MSILEKVDKGEKQVSLLWDGIPLVGQHVGKQGNSWAESIAFYHEMRTIVVPVQIFTGSPQSYARKAFSAKEIREIEALREATPFKLFVHSAYIINLCREFEDKQRKYITAEFEASKSIGSNGVVFHVGKSLKMDINEARETMILNILEVVNNCATKECPFLLETPAGQGTETLVSFEEFTAFYQDVISRLEVDNRERFKVCIDTCHVFAADHDPEIYIRRWLEENEVDSLALVHFNDSMGVCGCHVDRHQEPGTGRIGGKCLTQVYDILVNCNIPAVYE